MITQKCQLIIIIYTIYTIYLTDNDKIKYKKKERYNAPNNTK